MRRALRSRLVDLDQCRHVAQPLSDKEPRERRDCPLSPLPAAPLRLDQWFPAVCRREVILMNVQIFNKRFGESFWLQTTALAIVTLALIALGAKYVW